MLGGVVGQVNEIREVGRVVQQRFAKAPGTAYALPDRNFRLEEYSYWFWAGSRVSCMVLWSRSERVT